MSGDEERVSKRARTNYPGKVSFGALSKEENAHSVAQVSRCTDTGTCAWTEDGTKPQLLGGLGEEVGGGSSLQQTAEEEFGQLCFLLGEPQVCLETSTDAAAVLLEQAVSDPQKIRDKLLQLAVQLAGECQHSQKGVNGRGGRSMSKYPCAEKLDTRLNKNGDQISTRKGSITRAYSKSSMFAIEQVGVSELDTLRINSTYTVLGGTMRCNTSMMTSELGRRLIKRRGGYRPNASDNYNTRNRAT